MVLVRGDGRTGHIDSAGSNFDTVMGVYDLDLSQIVCVDDVGDETGFSLQAAATVDTAVGVTYLVQIGGFGFFEADNQVAEAEKYDLGSRTHYNLACFYSTVLDQAAGKKKKADATAKALEHLRWGVEPGGAIRQWAMDDPSLSALRSYPPKAAFLSIVQGRPVPEPRDPDEPSEVAGLFVVGKLAGELANLEIETFGSLVQNAATHGLRVHLVTQAPETSVDLLERAASLADLIGQHRLVDVSLGNILDRAGVGSIELLTSWVAGTDPTDDKTKELYDKKVASLASHLNATIAAVGARDVTPATSDSVAELIQQAAKMTPRVVPEAVAN